MTEIEKLEQTRVAMQQETSAAYLSALRVIGKLEAERNALRKLLEESTPFLIYSPKLTEMKVRIRKAIDAARREA